MLLVGTRTAQNGTDSWTMFSPDARFIHIDIDPGEIGRNYEALRLVGDAKLTLAALRERLRGRRGPAAADEAMIAEARRRHAAEIEPLLSSDASADPPRAADGGSPHGCSRPTRSSSPTPAIRRVWVASYLQSLAPGMRFITPRGLAGLGWGLPLAMGAKTARPQSPVLCVVGDGGFAHVWSELETCRRTGVAVVLTVLNNGVLGYQKDAEDVKFGRHTNACYFEPVDHAAIARACSCRGTRVSQPVEYLPIAREALASGETWVIDVITDPEAYPPITLFEGLDAFRRERLLQSEGA